MCDLIFLCIIPCLYCNIRVYLPTNTNCHRGLYVYSPAQLRKFAKLAREAAGLPEVKSMSDMAKEHQQAAIDQINALAIGCPIPEVRLKASQAIIELAKANPEDAGFDGDPDAVQTLIDAPREDQRKVALKLYVGGFLNKRDLDVVLKVIDADQTAQLQTLLAANQSLEKALIQATAPTIDGKANKPKNTARLTEYMTTPVAPVANGTVQ